jgi:hypothetical protein
MTQSRQRANNNVIISKGLYAKRESHKRHIANFKNHLFIAMTFNSEHSCTVPMHNLKVIRYIHLGSRPDLDKVIAKYSGTSCCALLTWIIVGRSCGVDFDVPEVTPSVLVCVDRLLWLGQHFLASNPNR